MYLAHHLIQLWYVDMLTQFVLCVVNDFFSLAHELLLACVLAVFFFFLMFFVHLCTCIISLSCKGGQHWWVFVPLWQPASAFLYACAAANAGSAIHTLSADVGSWTYLYCSSSSSMCYVLCGQFTHLLLLLDAIFSTYFTCRCIPTQKFDYLYMPILHQLSFQPCHRLIWF